LGRPDGIWYLCQKGRAIQVPDPFEIFATQLTKTP
jgi:hypothetical protein